MKSCQVNYKWSNAACADADASDAIYVADVDKMGEIDENGRRTEEVRVISGWSWTGL